MDGDCIAYSAIASQEAVEWSFEITKLWEKFLKVTMKERNVPNTGLSAGQGLVRKVPLTEVYKHYDSKIRKVIVGANALKEPMPNGGMEKTILLVGETGSGKTTLIDGMFNYISGVRWDDPHRWKLTDTKHTEETVWLTETDSQTKWITVYTIPKLDDRIFPFTLNIIDTPGFLDTKGIESDRKLVEYLTFFFNEPSGRHGITHIDAVGFVVKASVNRLTAAQEYVFNSVMAIFGKNLEGNIFALATFADGMQPLAYKALRDGNIPIEEKFKFNNSALYIDQHLDDPDGNDEASSEINKFFWDVGAKSYQKFLERLMDLEPKSIHQTAEVLRERRRLEIVLENIKDNIYKGCNKMNQLAVENKELCKHKADMDNNINFEITRPVTEAVLKKNAGKLYTLFCNKCSKQCHYPCVKFKFLKYFCHVFTWGGKCQSCAEICGSSCGQSDHTFKDKHEVSVTVTKKTTYKDMKAKYEKSKGGLDKKVNIMDEIAKEYELCKDRVARDIKAAKTCHDRISEIALREDPLTNTEFIDRLIAFERSQPTQGYRDRIEMLLKVKETYQEPMKSVQTGTNPLPSLSKHDELNNFLERSCVYSRSLSGSANN